MSNLKWCRNCLNASTRPRISFDKRGWCNACQWMEEKRSIDWDKREEMLLSIIGKHKRHGGPYDCIVAVSGGKDGSYVSHTLKTRYGLTPLCITVRPPLSLDIGDDNLKRFINSGYEHLLISPNSTAMQKLDRVGFINFGQGYYGWLISIHTAVLRIAERFGISLVFYSEDGEIEYGGSTSRKNEPVYGIDYMRAAYLNSTYEQVMTLASLGENDSYWFSFPDTLYEALSEIEVTHFSFYDNWDPYRNYLIAKEFCGMKEQEESSVGTFTNFSQTDQKLAALHYYLMYLKFGFGRATQDAGIEIRRGSMSRDQAINLVKLYDDDIPVQFYEDYCNYYQLSRTEFEEILDNFANKELFEKIDGRWVAKFTIK